MWEREIGGSCSNKNERREFLCRGREKERKKPQSFVRVMCPGRNSVTSTSLCVTATAQPAASQAIEPRWNLKRKYIIVMQILSHFLRSQGHTTALAEEEGLFKALWVCNFFFPFGYKRKKSSRYTLWEWMNFANTFFFSSSLTTFSLFRDR